MMSDCYLSGTTVVFVDEELPLRAFLFEQQSIPLRNWPFYEHIRDLAIRFQLVCLVSHAEGADPWRL
jgi:hypothetical protein